MLNLNTQSVDEENTFVADSLTRESGHSGPAFSVLQQFTEVWMLEHESPDLLPYEDILVKSVFSLIAEQKQNIQSIPPGSDSSLLSNLLAFEVRR